MILQTKMLWKFDIKIQNFDKFVHKNWTVLTFKNQNFDTFWHKTENFDLKNQNFWQILILQPKFYEFWQKKR